MSMNLIALLVSLAMMLTGAGGAAQPEAALPAGETARTLTLSNVSMTWNGQTLQVDPQVRFGVSTDGKKALYDFAVEMGDKVLLPMQLSAGEEGVTVLSGNSAQYSTEPKEREVGTISYCCRSCSKCSFVTATPPTSPFARPFTRSS